MSQTGRIPLWLVGLVAGLAAFVAMFFINKNKGGNVMGSSMSVQKMDVGQPGF